MWDRTSLLPLSCPAPLRQKCQYTERLAVSIHRSIEFLSKEESAKNIAEWEHRMHSQCLHAVLTCPAIQKNRLALEVSPHGDDCDLIFRPRLQTWKQAASAGLRTGSGPWSPGTALPGIRQGEGWGCASPLKTTIYLRQLKSCRTSGTRGITEELTGQMDEMNLMRLWFLPWAIEHTFPNCIYSPNVFLLPTIIFP